MNIVKVQTEYLKRLIKREETIFMDGIEGKIGVSDGKAVYFIPNENFYLDRKGSDLMSAKSLLTYFDRSGLAVQNGEFKETNDGEVVQLSNEDNTVVWVLKKYITCFEKSDRFYVVGPLKPVYVTDNDFNMQAVILPYVVKTNN